MLTAGSARQAVTEPTILAAWEGADREGASMNGGTLKGLDPDALRGRVCAAASCPRWPTWRIGSSPTRPRISGSARRCAMRRRATAGSWKAVRTCSPCARCSSSNPALRSEDEAQRSAARLRRRSRTIRSRPRIERDEPRANYACGAVFALVAEKANAGDFFAFTRRLIDANRADRELTSAEWLAALDSASGSPRHSAAIRELAERGSPDPKTAIAAC